MVLSGAKQRLAGVVGMLLWCVGLVTYRGYLAANMFVGAGEKSTHGLLWNLFLAGLPLVWSSAFQSAASNKRPALAGIFFVLWLLFLPNAPYILTDILHLRPSPTVPLWYLLAVLLSCAGTGTMLGYFSLLQVHTVIERTQGKRAGWGVVVGSLLLCGFGIYLGRFLHWNSWDVFIHPIPLVRTVTRQLINPGPHARPLAVTFVYGIGLLVGYLVLRVFSTAANRRDI